MFLILIKLLLNFIQNLWGTFQYPHATYKRIAKMGVVGKIGQISLIWLLSFLAFAWAMAVKNGIFRNPYFFVLSTGKFSFYAILSFIFITALIFLLGKMITKTGSYIKVATLWSYSYLPTILWFLLSSFLFFLFPPPRSNTYQGYLLSGFLIIFSTALLYWKMLLYYLTLRIGFKMTLRQVITVSMALFPIVVIYSFVMFRYGIFKVPFI